MWQSRQGIHHMEGWYGEMTDRVKERAEEVRSDEKHLIAALRSEDPKVREAALIQMVITVGRGVDDIGSRWSEWSAHYTEARGDIKALASELHSFQEELQSCKREIKKLKASLDGGIHLKWLPYVKAIQWPVSVPLTALIIFIGLRPQVAGAFAKVAKAFVGVE